MAEWTPIADAKAAEKKAPRLMLWIKPCPPYPEGAPIFGRWIKDAGLWFYDHTTAMGLDWTKRNQPSHFRPQPEAPTE